MLDRRECVARSAALAAALAGFGLLPPAARAAWPKAAFEVKGLGEVVKALGGAAPSASKEVTLTGPDIAEDGAAVQLSFGSSLPGVQRLALLVERNPFTLAAVFELGASVVPVNLSTRLKMGESSNVYAVAFLGDGRVLYAVKDIRVTLSGCG